MTQEQPAASSLSQPTMELCIVCGAPDADECEARQQAAIARGHEDGPYGPHTFNPVQYAAPVSSLRAVGEEKDALRRSHVRGTLVAWFGAFDGVDRLVAEIAAYNPDAEAAEIGEAVRLEAARRRIHDGAMALIEGVWTSPMPLMNYVVGFEAAVRAPLEAREQAAIEAQIRAEGWAAEEALRRIAAEAEAVSLREAAQRVVEANAAMETHDWISAADAALAKRSALRTAIAALAATPRCQCGRVMVDVGRVGSVECPLRATQLGHDSATAPRARAALAAAPTKEDGDG